MKPTWLLAISNTYQYNFNHVLFPRWSGASYHTNEIKIIL